MFRCGHCGAFNRIPRGPRDGTPVCGRCKRELDLTGRPQPVDAAGLERALASSPLPVVVDFWAPWCGPCRAVAPALDQASRQRAGRVLVLKLDTQAEPAAAARHGVQAIPTFVAFQSGRELERQSGAMPLPMLADFLERAAGASPAA